MKCFLCILGLTLSLIGWIPCSVQAQPLAAPVAFAEPWLLTQSKRISAEEAARRAQSRYGGKVLSIELRQTPDGKPYYRVKLLSNGDVRVVRIDATN